MESQNQQDQVTWSNKVKKRVSHSLVNFVSGLKEKF